ncbi:MAG: hypothetical protein N2738_04555 [Thermodesulfovibrionales bacterium]|nr:hypothetical protein [Thermodesulfovibrionales bacterium]
MKQDKLLLLDHINNVFEDLQDFLPLSLRQVYYQLVSALVIPNNRNSYIALSRLLKEARLKGLVSWDMIEDRTRQYVNNTGFDDVGGFVSQELNYFLEGYKRNVMQTQPFYVEVWVEKDALSNVFRPVCSEYGISLTICKGFSSVTFLHNYSRRVFSAYSRNQYPIVLFFSDFDPSGMSMMTACKDTLHEMGVKGIEFKRVALTPEQIEKYDLPVSVDAIKSGDTRAKNHIQKHGLLAVELDAIRPDILQGIIKEAIEDVVDLDLFKQELMGQQKDLWQQL